MKIAFTLFFCLAVVIDFFMANNELQTAGDFACMEASLDKQLAYIIVTASLLGVIKLKKNTG
ncbi:MAG: hypothetical protein H7Y13_16575 [Sphingobacteriaceae bacterium]|nr:hypothetical protein [Sphingobacteriaceae bacterium]